MFDCMTYFAFIRKELGLFMWHLCQIGALGHIFLRVFHFSHQYQIPPMLHTHSFILGALYCQQLSASLKNTHTKEKSANEDNLANRSHLKMSTENVTCPDQLCGLFSLLYKGVSGWGVLLTTHPFSTKVKKRAELYLSCPSRPSRVNFTCNFY